MIKTSTSVMKYFLILTLLHFLLSSYGQTTSFQCGNQFTDTRDEQIYQTVLIGSQCWMQQNINIGEQVVNMEQTDNGKIEKTCYLNHENWCRLLGGLYSWDEAMKYQNNRQGICPGGWHIPTKNDWQLLVTTLGPEEAGQKLKASPDTSPIKWDGTNESGFMAFPAGAGNHEFFKRKDQWALFWSSTAENNQRAWFTQLDSYWYPEPPKYKTLYLGNYYLKSNGFSIRCLQDE
jgi:uncharacterized protein (TIGR02145 family)